MTRAVCVLCGAPKFGALVTCQSCGQRPTDPEDLILSMALTDHLVDAETLESAAQSIQAGLRPVLDEESRSMIARALGLT